MISLPATTRSFTQRHRYWLLYILVLAFTSFLAAQSRRAESQPESVDSLNQLWAGFTDPPEAARLRCYWWWLNGHTDKATITDDLEQMKAKGFGGVLLVDANGSDQGGNLAVPAGPTFGSPAWLDLYRHALAEADRLGLHVALNITSGWNLGGPDVTPAQASKLLTWSTADITGGKHVVLTLPEPPIHNRFYRQIAVLAYPLRAGSQEHLAVGRRSLAIVRRQQRQGSACRLPGGCWTFRINWPTRCWIACRM
ncbi:MAG TPA: glycosyl hydrolase [Acidobacteriaceae bacterium]|nr:glycosyl hydrolase [Acidobacteriaceae bacterium]